MAKIQSLGACFLRLKVVFEVKRSGCVTNSCSEEWFFSLWHSLCVALFVLHKYLYLYISIYFSIHSFTDYQQSVTPSPNISELINVQIKHVRNSTDSYSFLFVLLFLTIFFPFFLFMTGIAFLTVAKIGFLFSGRVGTGMCQCQC